MIAYVPARLRKDQVVYQRFATELDIVVIEGQVHPEKRQEMNHAFNKQEKFQVSVISTLAGLASAAIFVVDHRNIKPGMASA